MQPPPGLAEFLDRLGWGDAAITPVAGDASFRRYFRAAHGDGRRAIIMDAPPPHEDPKPFIDLANYLRQHGFRAPAIWGQDLGQGIVLLEDFGDLQMRMHLDADPGDEADVYRHAIATLIQLRDKPPAAVPPYDMDAYLREVMLLAQYYIPAMDLEIDEAAFQLMWRNALAPLVATEPKVTVLRDYHSENIMLLDHSGEGEQGIIDFQDALIGHPAYDLVSLLQDARRDVSADMESEMLAFYCGQTNDPDFGLHYALLGAQRNTKIIGIFTRLWKRDGKVRYLDFLPRMWDYLERDLNHPGLAEIKHWFDANIPAEIRRQRPAAAPE
ncbi:MAG: phosphotransferase [Sphingorhabdus sp.]|nr:phosphotransferase [Sphingorhabdus sp.]